MASKKYLFDANALIDIGERFYPEDVFPGLWQSFRPLLSTAGEGAVTKKVLTEIKLSPGQVQPWRDEVKKLCAPSAFDEAEPDVQLRFAELSNLKQSGGLHKDLSDVDLFVLSVASVHGLTIITRDGKMKKAAAQLGISALEPAQLFHQLGWKFS